ncbi:tol-pal system protein YbgF [Aquabacter sp. L1I39]|uniref:tol-pal system protein YbgF n=1 Tax=Aquabacter sp. L1I39 TaxID=2820278 RepID=UPI001ADBF899|nr:tol-pal system protein YbgF [Aquabacter sp. L1I39]QTL04948.1 tol-pal system protein YbgF [Aquabacter sp. L1I39]
MPRDFDLLKPSFQAGVATLARPLLRKSTPDTVQASRAGGALLGLTAALVLAAAATGAAVAPAHAQSSSGNLFGDLFKPPGSVQQADTITEAQAELTVRVDRLENQLRQMTGQIEQLQFRNQQLEQQVRALTEGGARPAPGAGALPSSVPGVTAPPRGIAPANVGTAPGRRSDAFDPGETPGAPGAPQPLGSPASSSAGLVRPTVSPTELGASGASVPPGAGTQVATLPPSGSARDMFDLAAGYMQRQDYAAADPALRQFLQAHPSDRLVPEATYLLGESLFQRQDYKDAAENFLQVSTKYPNAPRAPEALLRLGQSLAALNEREAACATLGEVDRKYPRAASTLRQAVEREQKRVGC